MTIGTLNILRCQIESYPSVSHCCFICRQTLQLASLNRLLYMRVLVNGEVAISEAHTHD